LPNFGLARVQVDDKAARLSTDQAKSSTPISRDSLHRPPPQFNNFGMDPSTGTNNILSAGRLQHDDGDSAYPEFLAGIHTYGPPADQATNNDDLQKYFHPDLFDTQDITAPGPQQHQPQHNYQSAFTQHASRQSHSPALPAYEPNQPQFSHQPPFTQASFDPRTMYQNQQSFDPRFYQQRPSHSPAPLEQYPYQNNYHPQTFQHPQLQQRQVSSPAPAFPNNQQSYNPYVNFDSRNSQVQNQVRFSISKRC
jgi:hypothetical protein